MPGELTDLPDLIVEFVNEHSPRSWTESAKEQFRAQLIKLIDERIALAAQSAVRSGVAYRLHGESSGMHDPRG